MRYRERVREHMHFWIGIEYGIFEFAFECKFYAYDAQIKGAR